MRVIVEWARTSNLKAAEMVMQRIWPVRRNRPIELEMAFGDAALPNLLSEYVDLVGTMMNGHIAPQDAQAATRCSTRRRTRCSYRGLDEVEGKRGIAAKKRKNGRKSSKMVENG
jgi:hypothetical protein